MHGKTGVRGVDNSFNAVCLAVCFLHVFLD